MTVLTSQLSRTSMLQLLLEWRSIRIDASSGNLTSDLLQRLEDDVSTLGGEDTDTLIMHQTT
jgi:hypothetical protein